MPVAPPVIEMQAPERVILTLNEAVALTCNTTNVNGEIKLKWVAPPSSVRHFCSFLPICMSLFCGCFVAALSPENAAACTSVRGALDKI